MHTSPAISPSARDRVLLGLLAALPIVLAVIQAGYLHPDENFQYLEPAYRRAFGYGIVAWEWRQGLRNWAAPLFLAGILKIGAWLGATDLLARRVAVGVPLFLLQWFMLMAVYRFAARVSQKGRAAGAMAAVSVGLAAGVLLFAGRPLSETISTAFIVLAIEAITRDRNRARDAALAGTALGLAVVARYGSIPFVATVIIWLAARRQWKSLQWCIVGGLIVAILLGALDWITWGWPFASLWNYVYFNVFSGGGARIFGKSPPQFYLLPLVLMTPIWVWMMIPLALRKTPTRSSIWLVLFCAAVYLAIIFGTAHKERRFLYPAVVLLSIAASVGWLPLLEFMGQRRFAVAISLALLAGAIPTLFRPPTDADLLRAIIETGRDENTTGVAVAGREPWSSGGYFYLGRPVPFQYSLNPDHQWLADVAANPAIDRIIAISKFVDAPELSGFHQVRQIGRFTMLWRERDRSAPISGPTEYFASPWEATTGVPDR